MSARNLIAEDRLETYLGERSGGMIVVGSLRRVSVHSQTHAELHQLIRVFKCVRFGHSRSGICIFAFHLQTNRLEVHVCVLSHISQVPGGKMEGHLFIVYMQN